MSTKQPHALIDSDGSSDQKGLPAIGGTEDPGQGSIDQAVRLDALGPVVVNEDGTISRINNWSEMVDAEKRILEKRLLKRNQERLARLRDADASN